MAAALHNGWAAGTMAGTKRVLPAGGMLGSGRRRTFSRSSRSRSGELTSCRISLARCRTFTPAHKAPAGTRAWWARALQNRGLAETACYGGPREERTLQPK